MIPERLITSLADRYTIERELGQGGMATVYLARDLRHDRRVAIKVLRAELSAVIGAERFVREIKTIASLQHPHILGLIDSGEADGTAYYVMPYVEGESLRDRIDREKQLPIAAALRIATEVAGAIDYAHRHGVIHRDIKPENIMLHDGQALVTDFGIALAVSNMAGQRMTETGTSLGTPVYMSPEQAMGERNITGRSDVYALGAVTYEMLAGDPPFTGSTAQAIVAKVMTEPPRSMRAQRRSIPPHVEAAVFTALEKLPADRFDSAAAFADALANSGAKFASVTGRSMSALSQQASLLSLAPGGVLLLAIAAASWSWLSWRKAANAPATWQYITLGDSARINASAPNQLFALSPDGNTLVFSNAADQNTLWVKSLSQLAPHRLPGTDGASNPTFSPDGKWVAFTAANHLQKIALAGGPPIVLADSAAETLGGITWMDDNTLVYTNTAYTELRRISGSGGRSVRVFLDTTMMGGGLGTPTALPHARGALYQYCGAACVTQDLAVVDFKTGRSTVLLENALQGWYLPDGNLVYVTTDGTMMAVHFDLATLAIKGEPVPVVQGVFAITANGSAPVAWSPSGTLVYVAGSMQNSGTRIVRVALDGTSTLIDSTWTGQFNSLALSPDGHTMAVGDGSSSALDVWIKHLDNGPYTRLTFGNYDRRPSWSPDGKSIAYLDDSGAVGSVRIRAADGTGAERVLIHTQRRAQELAWSPDGSWLLVRTDVAEPGAGDIIAYHTTGDTTGVPLVATPYTEIEPAVSPDGHFFAYVSNESGTDQVYVRPFPGAAAGHWQVSLDGGVDPFWSKDGHALFYRRKDGWVVEAKLDAGPDFSVTSRQPLFETPDCLVNPYHQSILMAADGKSIYCVQAKSGGPKTSTEKLVWVSHWFNSLEAQLRK